jgi:hypothetical protein
MKAGVDTGCVMRLAVESGELIVNEPLELRIERLPVIRRRAPATPRPDQQTDRDRTDDKSAEREKPGEEPEPALGRRR